MRIQFLTINLFFLAARLASAGFLYHDTASTNGGTFASDFGVENLRNGGYTTPAATENASAVAGSRSYATTNPPAGGYPAKITLGFNTPVSLKAFYLWNHSNNGSATAVNQGVNAFTLVFFDGPDATGNQIGPAYTGNATKAPSSGTYAAQTFNFETIYQNVRSATLTVNNHNPSSNFVGIREIGFEDDASDLVYHDSASTNGGEFPGLFSITNLRNGGYVTAAALENAGASASGFSYATANPPTGGYPVTMTLEFNSPATLVGFYLWNHSNSGGTSAPNQGVNAFSLAFFDGPGGTGNAIGPVYSGNAAKAPATGTYPAQTFNFPSVYSNVRSAVFTANNHNSNSNFVGIREIAFKGHVAQAPTQEPDRVIVYLVGGQSNADGYGVTSELPAELQANQTSIDFFHGNGGGNSPLTANRWIRLRPGSGSMAGNAGGFGPELNFGIAMHQTLGSQRARIAVIKHTRGSTSLHTDWFPGGDGTTSGDGPLYQEFQSTVSSALASLAVLHPSAIIQVEGMIWHQGENDSSSDTNANAYQTNLSNFINDVRATYGGGMKFGIVRLSNNQTSIDSARLAIVKQAQANVAAANPLNYLVDTDDIPMSSPGNIHFGTPGVLTIGARLADGMLRAPITDADGNGLDDTWEQLHWGTGNTGQNPAADEDGDSRDNLHEFLWNTNPLAADIVSPSVFMGSQPSLSWPSSPARRYLIDSSADLETWIRLDSFIPGATGASTTYTVPGGAQRAFFRIAPHR